MGSQDQGADAIQNRWIVLPRTLCFVLYEDDILLMKRASHRRVFPNRYNGLGGHIERYETPVEGAIREIYEESGLEVEHVILRGTHMIDSGGKSGILLFTFTAQVKTRAFVDHGTEGTLHWINRQDVLRLDLVEDLPYILPRIFDMRDDDPPYHVHISYDENDRIQLRFNQ